MKWKNWLFQFSHALPLPFLRCRTVQAPEGYRSSRGPATLTRRGCNDATLQERRWVTHPGWLYRYVLKCLCRWSDESPFRRSFPSRVTFPVAESVSEGWRASLRFRELNFYNYLDSSDLLLFESWRGRPRSAVCLTLLRGVFEGGHPRRTHRREEQGMNNEKIKSGAVRITGSGVVIETPAPFSRGDRYRSELLKSFINAGSYLRGGPSVVSAALSHPSPRSTASPPRNDIGTGSRRMTCVTCPSRAQNSPFTRTDALLYIFLVKAFHYLLEITGVRSPLSRFQQRGCRLARSKRKEMNAIRAWIPYRITRFVGHRRAASPIVSADFAERKGCYPRRERKTVAVLMGIYILVFEGSKEGRKASQFRHCCRPWQNIRSRALGIRRKIKACFRLRRRPLFRSGNNRRGPPRRGRGDGGAASPRKALHSSVHFEKDRNLRDKFANLKY